MCGIVYLIAPSMKATLFSSETSERIMIPASHVYPLSLPVTSYLLLIPFILWQAGTSFFFGIGTNTVDRPVLILYYGSLGKVILPINGLNFNSFMLKKTRRFKMRKLFFLLTALLLLIPLVVVAGQKEEVEAEEVKMAEEGMGDEIDPWILDVREQYMKYMGSIPPSFRGPSGQKVTWSKDSLVLTRSEVAKIKSGNFKVAICWHVLTGDYIAAWRQGIFDACDYLNLEIVAETDAQYDPGKQASDVETVIPLKPDVIISVPIEPVTSAAAFRPAIDAGIKLSFVSNQPDGYIHGVDYIGITTANCHDRGLVAADLIGNKIGKNAKIALVTWGVDYWFTKYSDELVRKTIGEKFPGITVLADEQFIEWEKAGDVAAAIIQ